MQTIVLKFGGASVANIKNILKIADIIIDRSKVYKNILVVVSAMGKTTNKLINLAKRINENPSKREQDMLISVGERISMALLCMALEKKGKDAISFTGSQSGIITNDDHLQAKILDVKPFRILDSLNKGKIVIVAGFQGVSLSKEITTLGRGGSDTSAVALGISLNADCIEFYKDVIGIYNKDPKKYSDAVFLSELSFEKALDIIEKSQHHILHPRSVRLAEKNNLDLIIRSFKNYKKNKIFTIIKKEVSKKVNNIVYEEV